MQIDTTTTYAPTASALHCTATLVNMLLVNTMLPVQLQTTLNLHPKQVLFMQTEHALHKVHAYQQNTQDPGPPLENAHHT
jgi:hypothetical protein